MIGSNTTIYYGHQNPIYRKCINVPDIPERYNVPAADIHYHDGEDMPRAIYEWPGGNYDPTSERPYPHSGHAPYAQSNDTNNHPETHAAHESHSGSHAARQTNNKTTELTEPLDMATTKASTQVIY
jgi:hypothetical protein